MNFLGATFRSLAVVMVMLVSNASAYVPETIKLLNDNRCTLIGSLLVNKMINKDDLFTKTAVETTFYALDQAFRGNGSVGSVDMSDIDLKDAAEHFLFNIAIRKASQEFGKRVISFDAAAKKCDELSVPVGVKYYLDPVVREVAEQVTEPEMLIFLTCQLVPMVIDMLSAKNK